MSLRFVSVLCLTVATGCKRDVAPPNPEAAQPSASPSAFATTDGTLPPTDVVMGVSVYGLDASLTSQDGSAIKLDVFKSSPTIVSMFFTSCPSACPKLIKNIQAVEAQLSPEEKAKLRVLLISIDPENDTVDVLKASSERYAIDPSRWTMARADEETVREIAAVLGIKYRGQDGTINHSSVITILDKQGRIQGRADGAGAPPAAAVTTLRSLM